MAPKKNQGAAHGCFDLRATPLNVFVVPRIEFAETSSPRNCHMSPELRLRMASWVEKSSRAWLGRCGVQHLSMNCGALMLRSGAAHGLGCTELEPRMVVFEPGAIPLK